MTNPRYKKATNQPSPEGPRGKACRAWALPQDSLRAERAPSRPAAGFTCLPSRSPLGGHQPALRGGEQGRPIPLRFPPATEFLVRPLTYFYQLESPRTRVSNTLLLLLLSHFSRVRLFATPWTAAHQAPQSMGFSRQEHWRGVPLPLRSNTQTTLREEEKMKTRTHTFECSAIKYKNSLGWLCWEITTIKCRDSNGLLNWIIPHCQGIAIIFPESENSDISVKMNFFEKKIS